MAPVDDDRIVLQTKQSEAHAQAIARHLAPLIGRTVEVKRNADRTYFQIYVQRAMSKRLTDAARLIARGLSIRLQEMDQNRG